MQCAVPIGEGNVDLAVLKVVVDGVVELQLGQDLDLAPRSIRLLCTTVKRDPAVHHFRQKREGHTFIW
jgi:hypothetical protein